MGKRTLDRWLPNCAPTGHCGTYDQTHSPRRGARIPERSWTVAARRPARNGRDVNVHDEMLTLFDDCITRMLQLRAHLAVSRRVHPGERHATVVSAIEVAARFASEATRTVTPVAMPSAVPSPSAVASPSAAVPLGVAASSGGARPSGGAGPSLVAGPPVVAGSPLATRGPSPAPPVAPPPIVPSAAAPSALAAVRPVAAEEPAAEPPPLAARIEAVTDLRPELAPTS